MLVADGDQQKFIDPLAQESCTWRNMLVQYDAWIRLMLSWSLSTSIEIPSIADNSINSANSDHHHFLLLMDSLERLMFGPSCPCHSSICWQPAGLSWCVSNEDDQRFTRHQWFDASIVWRHVHNAVVIPVNNNDSIWCSRSKFNLLLASYLLYQPPTPGNFWRRDRKSVV